MSEHPITALLQQVARGDRAADERLAAAVVQRLEQIAGRELAQRNRGRLDGLTLEPRIFAHDALLKILEQPLDFENRRHFFAYATSIIVRAMIDYHRVRRAHKRGGDLLRVTFTGLAQDEAIDIEQVPPILDEFEALDPRKADVVRLRVFWGATTQEIADVLGVSSSSVERDWRFARRWLAARLRPEPDPDPATP